MEAHNLPKRNSIGLKGSCAALTGPFVVIIRGPVFILGHLHNLEGRVRLKKAMCLKERTVRRSEKALSYHHLC